MPEQNDGRAALSFSARKTRFDGVIGDPFVAASDISLLLRERRISRNHRPQETLSNQKSSLNRPIKGMTLALSTGDKRLN
jgi:hypothetical protein